MITGDEVRLNNARDDVEYRTRKLMVQEWGVDEARLTRDAKLGADLGIDSLDVIQLVMEIETEFDVDIPDDEIDGRSEDKTVGQFLDVAIKYALAA